MCNHCETPLDHWNSYLIVIVINDYLFYFCQTFYSVFGVVGGPVVGVFCLGMFTRRAHSRV